MRGKKVLIVTWASWCRCRDDLPDWQALYAELHPQGLELLSVAQDTGGDADAEPYFDKAHPTFTSIVDRKHVVTAAFHLVNVPSAIWIDEQGQIVRLDSGAYPKQRRIIGVKVGTAGYADALRDWVALGSESPFLAKREEINAELSKRSANEDMAEQEFRLGAHFYMQGDRKVATQHWETAQRLAPDNWNYHRQEWSDSKFESTFKFLGRALGRKVKGKPYYEPTQLPAPAQPD